MLVKLVDLKILIVHMFIKFEDLFVLNSAVYVYTCAHAHNVCTYSVHVFACIDIYSRFGILHSIFCLSFHYYLFICMWFYFVRCFLPAFVLSLGEISHCTAQKFVYSHFVVSVCLISFENCDFLSCF